MQQLVSLERQEGVAALVAGVIAPDPDNQDEEEVPVPAQGSSGGGRSDGDGSWDVAQHGQC